MKMHPQNLMAALIVAILSILNQPFSNAFAQSTAFTYQGQLQNNGSLASGTYNLQFSLYTTNIGGTAVAGPVTNTGVLVTNGLFTVQINFGSFAFTGETNWLQIGVETNLANAFTNLVPRQQLTPTPFAIYAENSTALAGGTAVGEGAGNNISDNGADDSFIGGGQANSIQFNSLDSFIGGGDGNTNLSNAGYSVIAGGLDNQTASGWSVIGGGRGNVITSGTEYSTIGGGFVNTNSGNYATVPGGNENYALGAYSFAAGDQAQALHQGAFVWADSEGSPFGSTSNNQFAVRANGGVNFVTSGAGMTLDGPLAVNGLNTAGTMNINAITGMNLKSSTTLSLQSSLMTLSAVSEIKLGSAGTIVDIGGLVQFDGTILDQTTFQGGLISDGPVGIGTSTPQQVLSVVGGINIDQGGQNTGIITTNALTFGSSSGEGIASQRTGTLPTGLFDLVLYTAGDPRLTIMNGGNVGIGNSSPAHLLVVGNSGSPAYCDGTTWQNGSDRNSKAGFAAINPTNVLAKVATLPISEWQYKVDAEGSKHLGPMAQDFHAAFGLNGGDDRHISTVDESGVALAAIQGLNEKLMETEQAVKMRDGEIQTLQQQNDSLAERLNELEATVRQLAAGTGQHAVSPSIQKSGQPSIRSFTSD